MNLQDLIERALANAAARKYWLGSAEAQTSAGRVVCFADTRKSNPRARGDHVCVRFDLNGKRISRANLEKLLAA